MTQFSQISPADKAPPRRALYWIYDVTRWIQDSSVTGRQAIKKVARWATLISTRARIVRAESGNLHSCRKVIMEPVLRIPVLWIPLWPLWVKQV